MRGADGFHNIGGNSLFFIVTGRRFRFLPCNFHVCAGDRRFKVGKDLMDLPDFIRARRSS